MKMVPKMKIEMRTGEIGETFARDYLEKNGYVICRYMFPIYGSVIYSQMFNPIGLCKHVRCTKKIDKTKCMYIPESNKPSKFCYEHIAKFPSGYTGSAYKCYSMPRCPCIKIYPKICDGCDQHPCLTKKILLMRDVLKKKTGREPTYRIIDFLAHKDGKHYFVEVKTNTATLSKRQREFLTEGRNVGIKPLLIRARLDFECNIKEEEF